MLAYCVCLSICLSVFIVSVKLMYRASNDCLTSICCHLHQSLLRCGIYIRTYMNTDTETLAMSSFCVHCHDLLITSCLLVRWDVAVIYLLVRCKLCKLLTVMKSCVASNCSRLMSVCERKLFISWLIASLHFWFAVISSSFLLCYSAHSA